MNLKKVGTLVIAALVLGLVLGNVLGVSAAPASSQGGNTQGTVAAACSGLGLKLGGAVRDAGGRLSEVVAELTGLKVEDVQAKRTQGESFAQIAKEEGVSSSAVVDEALKVRKQLLDQKVKDGTITRAQADDALARMSARLTDRVDSTAEGCGGGGCGQGGGGRGAGRGCGQGGGGCGQASVNQ